MELTISLPDDYAECVTKKFGSVEALLSRVVLDCVQEAKREEAAAKTPEPESVDTSLITFK